MFHRNFKVILSLILIMNIFTQHFFEKAFYKNVKLPDYSKQAEVINKYQDVIIKLAERIDIAKSKEHTDTAGNLKDYDLADKKEESDSHEINFTHIQPSNGVYNENLDETSYEYERLREGHSISVGFLILLRQLGLGELAANLLWIQMDADFHAGLWHRGRFALELIPRLDPTFIEAYLLLAFTYTNEKKHKESLELLEKVANEYPNRYEIFEQLGVQYYNSSGRYGKERYIDKALIVFKYIVTNFPNAPHHFHRFIARAQAELGKVEEALNYLKKMLKTPDLPEYQKDKYYELINRLQQEYKIKPPNSYDTTNSDDSIELNIKKVINNNVSTEAHNLSNLSFDSTGSREIATDNKTK